MVYAEISHKHTPLRYYNIYQIMLNCMPSVPAFLLNKCAYKLTITTRNSDYQEKQQTQLGSLNVHHIH